MPALPAKPQPPVKPPIPQKPTTTTNTAKGNEVEDSNSPKIPKDVNSNTIHNTPTTPKFVAVTPRNKEDAPETSGWTKSNLKKSTSTTTAFDIGMNKSFQSSS